MDLIGASASGRGIRIPVPVNDDEQHYKTLPLLDINNNATANQDDNYASIELASSSTKAHNFHRSNVLKKVGGGGLLSQHIVHAVRLHHITSAKNEHKSKSFASIVRYIVAVLMCVMPVLVFTIMELTHHDEWLFDDTLALDTYLVLAAVCGGVGGMLLTTRYDIWEYALSRFSSGFISTLSSVYTIYMILQVIPTTTTDTNNTNNIVPFGVCLFVGTLGAALPGVLIYFIVKIISDECWRYYSSSSSLSSYFDEEDDYTSSVTKAMILPSDEENNLE